MANPYINLYMNNPTEGLKDGTAISTDGTYSSPLTVVLDTTVNETKKVALAIRTEIGYKTFSDTTLTLSGDSINYWGLSLTQDGTYSESITLTNEINSTNTIFWAQASCTEDEEPTSDRSVSIRVNAIISVE